MADDLPFSICNILRSDFPNPSRISVKPRMLLTEPVRNNHQSLLPASSHQSQIEARDRHDGALGSCCCRCEIRREASTCSMQNKEGKFIQLII